MADQLRWAEVNGAWGYMEDLLRLIWQMGGRVIVLDDPAFSLRHGYVISFEGSEVPAFLKPNK